MPDTRRLIVVSNRLPVVLKRDHEGAFTLRPGSGGLVTAFSPVLSHRGGKWIGWPGLPVEPEGAWRELLSRGFEDRGYQLSPVVLTAREVEEFYEGFSNAILWPLFHDMVDRCDFDPRFWYAYQTVNEKFAEVVTRETHEEDFVWVQDYQLIHVAEHVRARDARRHIGFFLHIPFPPPDIFIRLPWRGQILAALLAYDLIGFQTSRDLRNFLACLDMLLPEVEVGGDETRLAELRVGERRVKAGAFPIGIDASSFEEAARSERVEGRIRDLEERMGPFELILGVDRLDYSKGLPERLRAFGDALARYPELRERATLFQVVVPSREGVPEYQALKADLDQLVGEINGRFSTPAWVPIQYRYRGVPRHDLVAFYRMAKVGFVTSLKDGMNLVAKEFCACQVDGHGSLVLSEFAGSASQLQEGALLVNPHDVEGTADALVRALELAPKAKERRMEAMRRVVAEQDIFWWLDSYLSVALGEGGHELSLPGEEYKPVLDLEDAWVELE